VAPLGTVAILCNALIAPLVFHETFRFRDFTGIVFATVGAVTIVLSAKTEEVKVVLLETVNTNEVIAGRYLDCYYADRISNLLWHLLRVGVDSDVSLPSCW
jgi:hypothetical protein